MAGTGTDRTRSAGSPGLDAPSSAETRLRLLVEATAHLSDTLDLRAVARGVARTVVPALADVVHVDLVESLFHPEGGAVADSGVVLRVATVDLSGEATGPGGDDWLGYPVGGAAAVALASGLTRGEGGVGTGDGHGAGAASLFVPLLARGRVLGLVGLHRDSGEGPAFAAADVRARRGDRGARGARAGQRAAVRRGARPPPWRCSGRCCRASSPGSPASTRRAATSPAAATSGSAATGST